MPYRTRHHRWSRGPLHLELELLEDFEAASAALYADRARQGLPADPDLSPMFGVIWPSALVAVDWIGRFDVRGLRVLELGCGLGLPAMAAAAGGARVVASDHHPHARAFLQRNASRNGVEIGWKDIDFRVSDPEPVFDVVIATDVLFAFDMPPIVARSIAEHLAPLGRALLVDPGRAWSDTFESCARREGLTVHVDIAEADGQELFALTLEKR